MAVGLFGAMIIGQFNGSMDMAELTLQNLHPSGLAIFPFLFTTIACGAISGFHATQSPMMARCINRESETKRVFLWSNGCRRYSGFNMVCSYYSILWR